MTRHIPTYKCNEIQREISVQRIQSNHPTTQPLPRIILFHVQNTPTASRFTSRLPFPPNRWLPPPWNYKRARARAFYIRRAARNCLYPPAAWERAWQFFVTRAKKLQRALREIKKERKRISALTVIPNRRHSSSSSSPFSSLVAFTGCSTLYGSLRVLRSFGFSPRLRPGPTTFNIRIQKPLFRWWSNNPPLFGHVPIQSRFSATREIICTLKN